MMMERSAARKMVKSNDDDDDDALIGLPPGFRFHPTDEEIVTHYLTPKVLNRTFTAIAIGEADLNKSEPWDLPKKAKMGEKEWFFFCQRDRKYPTGMRTNRATESGYWKATGKDREIFRAVAVERKLIGMKKTLVFYKGRAPRGEKTNWVMHEFRLEGKLSYYNMPKPSQDEWVVCRVFHKTTGAQKSPVADHGLNSNSYLEDLLDSPSLLPPLMDPSTMNLDPTFITNPISYFSQTRPEILQEDQDYKNILVSSYNYNFDTNTYQANLSNQYVGKNLPYLASTSTLYWSNMGLKKEKDQHYSGSEKTSVSRDTGASNEITATTTETSSTSMLSNGLRHKQFDPDDDAGPSTFPELDSLLEY